MLTLLRLVIFAIAALSIFGMQSFADATFALIGGRLTPTEAMPGGGEHMQPHFEGRSYILYYDERIASENISGFRHIYKQYYIIGSGDKFGLVDSAGTVILPQQYQDIIIMPYTYILKQDDYWSFYDQENIAALDDNQWDEVQIELSEQGKIISDLVKVGKDDVYGATNHQGEIIIEPRWEGLELYTYEAKWPLIRVKRDNLFGFINREGETIISVKYDYAQLDIYSLADEDDSENIINTPIIYVCLDGDWGGIFRNNDSSPSAVDWQIEPSAEVLDDYSQTILAQ